jgi:hypothetical protein
MRSGGGSKGGDCASARSQGFFNEHWPRCPPRPNENCPLRIREGGSIISAMFTGRKVSARQPVDVDTGAAAGEPGSPEGKRGAS